MSVTRQFTKYVSQNILGMIGLSLYILADTYFISKAMGADGITALNLVLPVYNLLYAIGAMLGVGSATRFKILKSRQNAECDHYFANALFFSTVIGILFMIIGIGMPDKVVKLMGGNPRIVEVGTSYTRIFMTFSPCFMWNHIFNAFVRNDDAPSIAMAATLISSLFNIVMDYVLMFPCKMGMSGAALATACSPVVGILICCIHFKNPSCTVKLLWRKPSVKKALQAAQLGVSAFVAEISSGVITVAFNAVILGLAGNIGVAAYGVVANTSLIAVSVFNGIAQGAQPIASENYGKGNGKNIQILKRLSLILSVCMATLILIFVVKSAEIITAIFNSENNAEMSIYAVKGLKIYFIGFLFAGINIVGGSLLSAVEAAKWAFVTSIMRGFVVILICVFMLSALWGMTGVWMAFPVAEFITAVVTLCALKKVTT